MSNPNIDPEHLEGEEDSNMESPPSSDGSLNERVQQLQVQQPNEQQPQVQPAEEQQPQQPQFTLVPVNPPTPSTPAPEDLQELFSEMDEVKQQLPRIIIHTIKKLDKSKQGEIVGFIKNTLGKTELVE